MPLPLYVIGRQVGVPDEDLPQIKGWTDAWIKRMGLMQTDEESAGRCEMEIEAQHYFQPMFEKLRREPDDTLLSTLVNREIPEWGRPLTDNELHAEMMADLFVGGSETTTNALAAGVDAADRASRGLGAAEVGPGEVPRATFCEEVLRVESPVQGLLREAAQDIELHGVTIPAGSVLNAPLRGRQPRRAQFECPADIDLDARARRGATSPSASARTTASAPRSRGASCSTASRRSSTGSSEMWFIEGANDFSYHQNFFLRAVKEVHIGFKPREVSRRTAVERPRGHGRGVRGELS